MQKNKPNHALTPETPSSVWSLKFQASWTAPRPVWIKWPLKNQFKPNSQQPALRWSKESSHRCLSLCNLRSQSKFLTITSIQSRTSLVWICRTGETKERQALTKKMVIDRWMKKSIKSKRPLSLSPLGSLISWDSRVEQGSILRKYRMKELWAVAVLISLECRTPMDHSRSLTWRTCRRMTMKTHQGTFKVQMAMDKRMTATEKNKSWKHTQLCNTGITKS